MLTYNALLYTERKKRNLSRRKMAKAIKVSLLKYLLIEKGYLKPSKRLSQRISNYLDINYQEYLINEPSYPSELPDKEKRKITKLFYRIIGNLAFKITLIVLALLSVGLMTSGFIIDHNMKGSLDRYYEPEYISFVNRLKENGSIHFSITSDFTSPEYYTYVEDTENKTSEYVSIIGSYNTETSYSLTYQAIYRNPNGRLSYKLLPISYNHYLVSATYEYYVTTSKLTASFYLEDKQITVISEIDTNGNRNFYVPNEEKFDLYNNLLLSKADVFLKDLNDVIAIEDPDFAPTSENKIDTLLNLYLNGTSSYAYLGAYALLATYLGIALSGLNIFIVIYAFLYGAKKGQLPVYREAQLDVPILDNGKRIKTDTRITPFVPETFLEIVGILLVFIGSFRVVLYVSSFLNGAIGEVIAESTATNFTETFMLGMFLLYFIDFDIFLDDKRVFRSVALYSIIYICLWALENLIYQSVVNTDSVMGSLLSLVMLPNMFGSIACYYLIMVFLFYTPKWIKSKRGITIYRSFSILPVLIIFTSWFLYNGYNVLFDADWPTWLRTLFNGEKVPFSILAIAYLFSLFFLRLFFERRMGKERANIFFNGNRFLWIKNIMIALIILAIGIFELIASNNNALNDLGIGSYWNILFLIPLLLFYHPHKGERNIAVDMITMVLYILAISIAYLVVVVLVAMSL